MKQVVALGIKFTVIAIAVLSIFSIFENTSITSMLLISLLLVVLSYTLGDLFVLKRFGNTMASLGDFALAFLVLFFYGIILDIPMWDVGNAAAFTALFIGIGEAFLHFYLINHVFGETTFTDKDNRPEERLATNRLRTETSEEVFPYDVRGKKGEDE
jgi:hypothetical protein